MDPRLTRQYQGYHNEDPAPVRVKPMPLSVLHHLEANTVRTDPLAAAIIDLAWIAVFYLLRPGEYCKAPETKPLKLRHISLLRGARKLDHMTCSAADLAATTHSSITFDDQKNRERGEVIGHGSSGDPWACPTKALSRRIAHLRSNGADANTLLCAVRKNDRWTHVKGKHITDACKLIVAAHPEIGLHPDDISVRALRAGGAMALLCGGVDTDVIRLVGRWKSDAMFRYLHAQAAPLIQHLAPTMLANGAFTLLPGTDRVAEAEQYYDNAH